MSLSVVGLYQLDFSYFRQPLLILQVFTPAGLLVCDCDSVFEHVFFSIRIYTWVRVGQNFGSGACLPEMLIDLQKQDRTHISLSISKSPPGAASEQRITGAGH